MSILSEIKAMEAEFITLRRDIHAHPELAFQETRTSNLIAEHLKQWGLEVHTGIGKTGVVGVLHGSRDAGGRKRAMGIRADIDALPMEEKNELPYASTTKGCMHACGHDGHVAILLCAAKYLAQHRDFEGVVNFIFQPAEEAPPGGAKAMIEDGFFERFPCDEIYALHNRPGLEVGRVAFTRGAGFASSNSFTINIKGKGGHAASPQNTVDPIIIAAEMVMALQTVISRHKDPDEGALLSVTQVHAGSTDNIIP
ncbi:MAG: amidohydrolase, partial [Saezia sp.]